MIDKRYLFWTESSKRKKKTTCLQNCIMSVATCDGGANPRLSV